MKKVKAEHSLITARESPPIEVVSARPEWVELLVPCSPEAAKRIESFMMKVAAALPEQLRKSVAQAFHELLLNAIEWGGKFDRDRKVQIAYIRGKRMIQYRIADPGPGFRFSELDHTFAANSSEKPFDHLRVRQEKGLRPGGFGLFMVKRLADELIYNENQNEVIFVKYIE
jgi:anti-sigma regulatory factor (Ser/Thr protein kinase)